MLSFNLFIYFDVILGRVHDDLGLVTVEFNIISLYVILEFGIWRQSPDIVLFFL